MFLLLSLFLLLFYVGGNSYLSYNLIGFYAHAHTRCATHARTHAHFDAHFQFHSRLVAEYEFCCFIRFTSFRLILFRFRFFSSFYPLWRRFYFISTQSSDNFSISVRLSVRVCVWICAIFLSTAGCCQAVEICIYACFSRFAAISAKGDGELGNGFGFGFCFGLLQVGNGFENFYTIDLNSAQSFMHFNTHTQHTVALACDLR